MSPPLPFRPTGIEFKCGNCGRFSRAQARVPQCGVCNIPLCTTCNRSGFCAKHFETLTPDDQTIVRAIFLKMKQSLYMLIIGVAVSMVAITVGVPLSVTFGSPGGNPFLFPIIFMVLSTFSTLAFCGAIYHRSIIKRVWDTVQEIGQKYRTGSESLVVSPPQSVALIAPVSPPPLEDSISPDNSLSTPHCPYCGSTLRPTTCAAQICSNCGSTISSTIK